MNTAPNLTAQVIDEIRTYATGWTYHATRTEIFTRRSSNEVIDALSEMLGVGSDDDVVDAGQFVIDAIAQNTDPSPPELTEFLKKLASIKPGNAGERLINQVKKRFVTSVHSRLPFLVQLVARTYHPSGRAFLLEKFKEAKGQDHILLRKIADELTLQNIARVKFIDELRVSPQPADRWVALNILERELIRPTTRLEFRLKKLMYDPEELISREAKCVFHSYKYFYCRRKMNRAERRAARNDYLKYFTEATYENITMDFSSYCTENRVEAEVGSSESSPESFMKFARTSDRLSQPEDLRLKAARENLELHLFPKLARKRLNSMVSQHAPAMVLITSADGKDRVMLPHEMVASHIEETEKNNPNDYA